MHFVRHRWPAGSYLQAYSAWEVIYSVNEHPSRIHQFLNIWVFGRDRKLLATSVVPEALRTVLLAPHQLTLLGTRR